MSKQYNPDLHHRRSIRLKGYDYTQAGAYFITVCTQDRECLFGQVIDSVIYLNDAGEMLRSVWSQLPQHYPSGDIDVFVVMPNHVHSVVVLSTTHIAIGDGNATRVAGQPQGVAPTMSLPDVVHRFKSLSTAKYRQGVMQQGWQPFAGKLWQRNYYERIIRDEDELNRIREYIAYNPNNWHVDENNPDSSRFKRLDLDFSS